MGTLDELLKMTSDPYNEDFYSYYYPELHAEIRKRTASLDLNRKDDKRRYDLLAGLHTSLFSPPEKAGSQRQRYASAIIHISLFLMDEVPPVVIAEILELGNALIELDRGTVRPFLRVTEVPHRSTDPGDIWSCRALVAGALDVMMTREGMTTKQTSKVLLDDFDFLAKVLISKDDGDIASGAIYWRKVFKSKKCGDPRVQKLYDDPPSSFYFKSGMAPSHISRRMLSDATLCASRMSDRAMNILLPEIISRARGARRKSMS